MHTEYHIADITLELDRCNLLPAIVFRTARAQCDTDVQRAGHHPRLALPIYRQKEIKAAIFEVIQAYDMEADLILNHPHYPALVRSGIGAHHAGQLLMWRLLLEELMSAGVLRVLIATGTVAAGVDFPARTVVITAHSKRGGEGYKNLTAAEFQQMSGRAGRRGKDTVGFCVSAPSTFCDARELLKIAKKSAEPLVSAYFPSPSTVLNLLRYRNVDDLHYTIERSLAAYIDRKNAEKMLLEAQEVADAIEQKVGQREIADEEQHKFPREVNKMMKRKRRIERQAADLVKRQEAMLEKTLEGLRSLKHLDQFTLSEKGFWSANLCTSLVLELSEIIEEGMLTGVTTERMVAIIAAICADEHRQYLKTKEPPLSTEDIGKLQEIIERVRVLEMPGVTDEKVVVPNAAHTVLTWLRAETWQEFRGLLRLCSAQEGDAARLITQTAEHLHQITRLSETFPQLALRAEEGRRRLLRPPLTEAINLE